jgi:hypothetical protein
MYILYHHNTLQHREHHQGGNNTLIELWLWGEHHRMYTSYNPIAIHTCGWSITTWFSCDYQEYNHGGFPVNKIHREPQGNHMLRVSSELWLWYENQKQHLWYILNTRASPWIPPGFNPTVVIL